MTAEKIKDEQITKPKRLKPIDKAIVKLLAEGKSQTEAAKILNINRGTVVNHIKQNSSITETLDRCGITDEYLASKHKELLESQRKLYNPKTQTFEDVPDNNARNTALSIGYRVRGHLKDNPETNTNIQINLVKYGQDGPVSSQRGLEQKTKVIDMIEDDNK